MKRRAFLAIPLLAGLAAAIALTAPGVAHAWDINALPGGFSAASFPAGGSCVRWEIRGYNAAASITDCSDDATHADFQARLDAFIEANCPQDVCHPAPPVTTTAASSVPVTTTAPIVTDTTATTTTMPPVTVPVTTTVAPQTVTVTTVIVDPTIDARLALIEQRQATDEARITQLEHPPVVGLAPLGEPKNVAPFVAS